MKRTNEDQDIISLRQDILKFALERYQTEPDYPWNSQTDAVLRHKDTRKWYGLIMRLPRERLGLSGKDCVDILNIKCDPVLGGSLRMEEGFLPAYHMNRETWITILLDGTVDREKIFPLLEMSFDLTASHGSKGQEGGKKSRVWIVPANPKYYDLKKAFSQSETILWKQSSHISVEDRVFLYVAAPVSAILYQCQAVEVDIPYKYDDGKLHMSRVMKLKRLAEYAPDFLTWNKLKEYGVSAVRGPRSMPDSLLREIEMEGLT